MSGKKPLTFIKETQYTVLVWDFGKWKKHKEFPADVRYADILAELATLKKQNLQVTLVLRARFAYWTHRHPRERCFPFYTKMTRQLAWNESGVH
jgi:hypothetical protein